MAPPNQTPEPRATGTGTVTVACKVPHGLVLRLQMKTKVNEPVMGGGTREVEIYVPRPDVKTYTVNGPVTEQGKASKALVVDGFALTTGVPADFWQEWLSQNRELGAVVNGLIFAHEKKDSVDDMAAERKAQRTGLEPMDMRMVRRKVQTPDGEVERTLAADPRVPRSRGMTIEPADVARTN